MKQEIDHLYVFPDCVSAGGKLISLDIEGSVFTLKCGGKSIAIDTERLESNTASLVIYDNKIGELFMLRDYGSFCHKMNWSARDMLVKLQQNAFLQIDKMELGLFVKVFLPHDQLSLPSATHDFSLCAHFPASAIHPVDWQYQASMILRGKKMISEDEIELELESIPALLTTMAHWQYGQSAGAMPAGVHKIRLAYVPGQPLCVGDHAGFERARLTIEL